MGQVNIPEEIVVPVVLYFLALVTYTARTVRRIMANHLTIFNRS